MYSYNQDNSFVKLFILYLMKNIGIPLDYNTISEVVIQDEYVGYFDFAQCFAELLDAGHISETKTEDGRVVYSVTETGEHVVGGLSDDIMVTIREKSLKSALKLISLRRRGVDMRCEITEVDAAEGFGYYVYCVITEQKREVFSVRIRVNTREQALAIKKNFMENPENIKKGALALLTGDVNYIFS